MTDKLSDEIRDDPNLNRFWVSRQVAALEADNTALRKQINDPSGAWADLERKLEIAEERVEGLEEGCGMDGCLFAAEEEA